MKKESRSSYKLICKIERANVLKPGKRALKQQLVVSDASENWKPTFVDMKVFYIPT